MSQELLVTVEILDLEDSPGMEDHELRLMHELHAVCERRAVVRKALGIKPRPKFR